MLDNLFFFLKKNDYVTIETTVFSYVVLVSPLQHYEKTHENVNAQPIGSVNAISHYDAKDGSQNQVNKRWLGIITL